MKSAEKDKAKRLNRGTSVFRKLIKPIGGNAIKRGCVAMHGTNECDPAINNVFREETIL